jgi:nucleoid-associated protein YgaU
MSRYNGTQTRIDKNGRQYRGRTDYPKFPLRETDIYYVTQQGDRLDLLAQRYYGNVTKWFIISEANNLEVLSYDLKPGVQLRRPREGY